MTQTVQYLIHMPTALKNSHFQQLCCITLLILLCRGICHHLGKEHKKSKVKLVARWKKFNQDAQKIWIRSLVATQGVFYYCFFFGGSKAGAESNFRYFHEKKRPTCMLSEFLYIHLSLSKIVPPEESRMAFRWLSQCSCKLKESFFYF